MFARGRSVPAAAVFVAAAMAAATASADPDPGYPFTPVASYSETDSVLAAADFDGDGRDDLLTTGLRVRFGKPRGTLTKPRTIKGTGTVEVARVADLNGDGAPDIVAGDETGGEVRIRTLLNDGGASFSVASTRRTAAANGSAGMFLSFVVADTDGDDNPDVALLGPSAVARMATDGAGVLSPPDETALSFPPPDPGDPQNPVTLLRPTAFAAGDFNADGRNDLVFAFRTHDLQPSGPVAILDGEAGGSFSQRDSGASDSGSDAFAVGDLSGDDVPDVVGSAQLSNSSHSSIFTFITQPDYSLVRGCCLVGNDGYAPVSLADLDHDGSLDIASAWAGPGAVTTVTDPEGSPIVAGENLETGSVRHGVPSLALGDFNGDGWADVAESASDYGTIIELNTKGAPAPPTTVGLQVGLVKGSLKLRMLANQGLKADVSCFVRCRVFAYLRTNADRAARQGLQGNLLRGVSESSARGKRVDLQASSRFAERRMRAYRGGGFRARLKIVAKPIKSSVHGESSIETLDLFGR